MTRTEAIRKIEQWLLVPIDYEDVLPALAALAGTEYFGGYVDKVAEAEFRTSGEILADIERYMAEEGGDDALDRKPGRISGGRIRAAGMDEEEDVLEIVRKAKSDKMTEPGLLDRYNSYVDDSMASGVGAGGSRRNSRETKQLVPVCNRCGDRLELKTVKGGMTCGGIALFLVLLIVFFPLAIIPILYMREEKKAYFCTHCGRRKEIGN